MEASESRSLAFFFAFGNAASSYNFAFQGVPTGSDLNGETSAEAPDGWGALGSIYPPDPRFCRAECTIHYSNDASGGKKE